jgi:hypothetical protein
VNRYRREIAIGVGFGLVIVALAIIAGEILALVLK